MTTLQVVFDPECGSAVPDARAKSFVQETIDAWLDRQDAKFMSVIVGTEVMFDSFRLHFLRNMTIPTDPTVEPFKLDWTFWYKDQQLEVNSMGVITTPYDSLSIDLTENCLCEGARLSHDQRKREGGYPRIWKDKEA